MRTNSHARTDRRATPRRLVPRRGLAANVLFSLCSAAPRFCNGDMVTFEAADGQRHIVTILGIHADGSIDGMLYHGQPHFFPTTVSFLSALRVIEVRRMPQSDVDAYRFLLELPVWSVEVAA